MTARRPPAPRSLGPAGKALWRATVAAYDLGPGAEPALLQAMCQAWDRHVEAQAILDAEGVVIATPQGSKVNPAVAVADRMAQLTAKIARQLRLELPPEAVEKARGGGGRPATVRKRAA